MAFFPMFFDLEGLKILVVGAGRVGSRRIETLLSFGALITAVSLNPSRPILKLAEEEKIKLVHCDYRSFRETAKEKENGSLYFMVIAATGDLSVDELVMKDAKEMNAFVNVAGDRELSDFYFPGIAKEGMVTAGIIGDGVDHKLAKQATKQVEAFLQKNYRG